MTFQRTGSIDTHRTAAHAGPFLFDGSPSTFVVTTGSNTANGVITAVWDASTLVITSRVQGGSKEVGAVDRLTLGADGKTFSTALTNSTNGVDIPAARVTIVFRRM
jgi:hypothetical protein